MRIHPTLAVLATASVATMAIAACGSSHEDAAVTIESTGPTIQAKPNPCAAVKCPDAMHCVARGKHASCVADPACTTDADCYLYSGQCSGANACTCTAHESSVRIGCSTSPITCTHDACGGYSAACVNGACAKVAVGTATPCVSDSDCRTFSSACDTCSCRALTAWSPDPTCSGTTVQCPTDPCLDATAVCTNGTCAISSAIP